MSKNSTKNRRRARKKSPKVRFESTGRNLTSQAGLIPVVKFLDKLGFNGLFNRKVHHQRANNAQYSLAEGVFLIMTGLIGGAFSIGKCVALWSDGVLRQAAGWKRIPDETTVGRLFKEVGNRQVSELETLIHAIRGKVWHRALRAGVSRIAAQCTQWIDVDSSVKTVYGNQEGTAKGYNPHKRGARSYHPLLAFSAHTKEILQGWFRTGSAYTSNGIVEFMKQLLAQLPDYHRIIFRGDSGYFVGALLELLDQRGHGYLIKVKLKNLVHLLGRQYWSPVSNRPGWEQCEFQHQAGSWSHPRFFVAVRQLKEVENDSPQGELLEMKHYDYFCYVTTEPLTPWQTHRKYGERATSETWIEEGKSQMGLAHMKTDHFLANAALFQSAILAYNTLRWMALMSNNKQLRQWEPETIRTFLVRVAGKLLTGSNQLTVKLPKEHLYPRQWEDWLALA